MQLSLASDGQACALTASGDAACWGALMGEQGGHTVIPGPFIQVAVAAHFSCAIKVDGTLQCWGEVDRQLTQFPDGTGIKTRRFLEVAAQ